VTRDDGSPWSKSCCGTRRILLRPSAARTIEIADRPEARHINSCNMDLDKVSLSQYYTLRIAGQGSRDQGNQSKGLDVDEVFESCHQPSRQRMRRGWLRMRESQRVEMAVCRSVCSELKDHVFCSRVLFCVLSSQRGSSRVYSQ
jgi:hypothetical protein